MGIKKQYLKSKPKCKVTFRIPSEISKSSESAAIVGEFNNWDKAANPMKRLKNGAYVATLDLEPGKEYQYRFVLDENVWQNDTDADKYVPTPFGDCDNSVVVL